MKEVVAVLIWDNEKFIFANGHRRKQEVYWWQK